MGFLASILGNAVAKVITTLLLWFGIYRAGEKAEAQKDAQQSLKDATDARKIDSADSQLSDAELDKRLRGSPDNS